LVDWNKLQNLPHPTGNTFIKALTIIFYLKYVAWSFEPNTHHTPKVVRDILLHDVYQDGWICGFGLTVGLIHVSRT
jgi:hypothetical protein